MTLAFIFLNYFSLETLSVIKSCPVYNLKTVPKLNETLYEYQSTVEQRARTITLAFILFELFPLEVFLSQN